MKGVVIPQSGSLYEKLEKTPVGQQKYWWDLFYSNYKQGEQLLTMLMKHKDTANQIASNKYAMRIIMGNYEYSDDVVGAIKGVKDEINTIKLRHNA